MGLAKAEICLSENRQLKQTAMNFYLWSKTKPLEDNSFSSLGQLPFFRKHLFRQRRTFVSIKGEGLIKIFLPLKP
jgi:hypothetical protein